MLLFISFWMYPLALGVLVYLTAGMEPDRSFFEYLWLIPAGLLLWSALEYTIHRLIHWKPANGTLRSFVDKFHQGHHRSPRNPDKIFVHPCFSLPFSFLIFAVVQNWTESIFTTTGLMGGVWVGFLYHELVHYCVHMSSATRGLTWHRKRHFIHHFIDDSACYGVTSPVWDGVFGTFMKL